MKHKGENMAARPTHKTLTSDGKIWFEGMPTSWMTFQQSTVRVRWWQWHGPELEHICHRFESQDIVQTGNEVGTYFNY